MGIEISQNPTSKAVEHALVKYSKAIVEVPIADTGKRRLKDDDATTKEKEGLMVSVGQLSWAANKVHTWLSLRVSELQYAVCKATLRTVEE